MKWLLSAGTIAASTAILMTGCVPIPLADAPPFEGDIISGLQPGSSRADVVFALGAPHFVHDNERVFVYTGVEAKMAYVFILGAETAGGVGGGAVGRFFLFVTEFDEAGSVQHLEVLDLGLDISIGEASGQGHQGIVCTAWDLCLRDGGEFLLPGVVTDDPQPSSDQTGTPIADPT